MLVAAFLLAIATALDPVRFGCAYYPEAWDESRWGKDLDDMKALGLSAVRVGEFNWSGLEPTEGHFDFSSYERFLELCEERGFEVMMCYKASVMKDEDMDGLLKDVMPGAGLQERTGQ